MRDALRRDALTRHGRGKTSKQRQLHVESGMRRGRQSQADFPKESGADAIAAAAEAAAAAKAKAKKRKQ